ncbi:MAG: hypothetical protein ACYC2H_05650 [Thermoplasmatota archaeon]
MRWLTLALPLLLAGCLVDPAGPDALGPGAPGATDGGRTAREGNLEDGGHFDSTFKLQIRDAIAATACVNATCLGSFDCYYFLGDPEGPGFALSNGTVVMTWDAVTPLAEHLVVAVSGADAFRTSGTSPLTLAFDVMEPDDNLGVTIGVDREAPNVALEQEVSMHVVFDYEGDLPAPFSGSCYGGVP